MEVKRVDTYVYKLVRNGQTVYIGITNDLKRREQEHREDKEFDKMQVPYRESCNIPNLYIVCLATTGICVFVR